MLLNAFNMEKSTAESITWLLKIYFDFAYYLCIAPFRFVLTESSVSEGMRFYKAKSSWYQKALCTSFTLLTVIWRFRATWTITFSPINSSGSGVYLEITSNIVNILHKMLTLKILWLDRSKLLSLLNCLLNARTKLAPCQRQPSVTLFFIYIVYTIMSLFPAISEVGLGITPGWWQNLQCVTQSAILFQKVAQNNDHCRNSSILHSIFGVVGVIVTLQRF